MPVAETLENRGLSGADEVGRDFPKWGSWRAHGSQVQTSLFTHGNRQAHRRTCRRWDSSLHIPRRTAFLPGIAHAAGDCAESEVRRDGAVEDVGVTGGGS